MPELTTVTDVKTYLGISGSTYDALLTALLDAAEQLIRDRCERPSGWTQAVFTETFDGENADRVVLKYTPIDTAYVSQAVTVDGTALATSEYSIESTSGVLGLTNQSGYTEQAYAGTVNRLMPRLFRRKSPNLGEGWRTVAVTYRGGYTTIPASLTMAAKVLVRWLFTDRQNNPGMQSETLGNYTYSRGPTEEVWAQIDAMIGRETASTYL